MQVPSGKAVLDQMPYALETELVFRLIRFFACDCCTGWRVETTGCWQARLTIPLLFATFICIWLRHQIPPIFGGVMCHWLNWWGCGAMPLRPPAVPCPRGVASAGMGVAAGPERRLGPAAFAGVGLSTMTEIGHANCL